MAYIALALGFGFLGLLAFLLPLALNRETGIPPASGTSLLDADGIPVRSLNRKVDLETVAKVLGPVIATLPIVVGVLQFVDAQRQNAANEVRAEFIRANQLLTEPAPKPIAGIIAMSQLAEDSVERTWQMTEALSAFIQYSAPRSDQNVKADRPHAPYRYDCKRTADPICAKVPPLYQRVPAIQAALVALANRNRANETRANAPPRMRARIESANREVEPGTPDGHKTTKEYILREWHQSQRDDRDSTPQLINETQFPVGHAVPGVMRRPWLNLSHSDMAGVELVAAFFEGGFFQGSDWSFSSLPSANFANAELPDSWIVGSNLYGSDLRGADLQFADVRSSDLGRTKLINAWLSGGDFSHSNFYEADLTDAYLVATNLRDVETMAGANLNHVIAFRANFTKANIAGEGASVHVCMQDAFLEEAVFADADARGVDLRSSDLEDADFSRAIFRGADLRDVKVTRAKLEGTDLAYADLRGLDLRPVLGVPATLAGAIVDEQTRFPHSWPADLIAQVNKHSADPVTASCAPAPYSEERRRELTIR